MINNYNSMQQPSFASELTTNTLMGFGMGGVMGTMTSAFRPGIGLPGYLGNKAKGIAPIVGGGWNNRFMKAGGMGLAEGFGFVRTTRTQRAALRQMGITPTRTSFLGWKSAASELSTQAGARGINLSAPGGIGRLTTQMAKNPQMAKQALKSFGPRAAFGALAVGFTLSAMHSGYQREGMYGAVKAGASEAAMFGAVEVGSIAARSVLGSAVGGAAAAGIMTAASGAMVVAGLGYGAKIAMDYGQQYDRKLRGLEMGGGVFDPYGTKATMRQRSLQAIQRSSINGRSALGNEGMLIHQTMR